MAQYLLDSDVIIELLRGNAEMVKFVAGLHGAGALLHFSPVNVAEIYHGLRPGEEDAVRRFFDRMVLLPVTRPIGERAGGYLNRFHGSHEVRLGDALLAATAVESKCKLLTLNLRHYPMKNLDVEKPAAHRKR